MVRGTVKWFNITKGFGFIEITSGSNSGDDVFVHAADIEGKPLRENDEVEFDVEDDRGGKKRAAGVTGGTGSKDDEERDRKGSGKGDRGGGKRGKAGDWDCDKCSIMNFASRDRCFKCGEPKREGRGGGGGRRNDSRGRGGRDGGRGGRDSRARGGRSRSRERN